jgi:O-antigen ligase
VGIALILIYFVDLYIRPQDWVSLTLNWPMDWIVFSILLFFVPLKVSRLPTVLKSHLLWMLVLWLAVVALSNLVHFDTATASDRFVYYAKLVVVFFSLLLYLETDFDVRGVVWLQILLSAILAIQCMDQVRTGIGWAGQPLGWDDGFGGRAKWVGLWDGMGVLSLLFVVAFPFLIQFFLGAWGIGYKAISLVLMGILFEGIALTQSRGGYIALVIVVILSIMFRFRAKKAVIPLAMAVVCLMTFAPARAGELDDSNGSKSASHRIELWSAGLTMVKENPVFGVGKSQFSHYAGEIAGLHLMAHNTFIENAAETGLVGLWVYVGLVYLVAKGAHEVLRKAASPRQASMARAMLVSIYGYVAASMFVSTDFDLFYVQLGVVAAFCQSAGCSPKLTKRDAVRIAAICVTFIVTMYVYTALHFGG